MAGVPYPFTFSRGVTLEAGNSGATYPFICCTTHKALKELSKLDGKVVTWEQPDGVHCKIIEYYEKLHFFLPAKVS